MDLIESMKELTNALNLLIAKAEIHKFLKEFQEIVNETKKRKEWFDKGLCYNCGGKPEPKDKNNIDTIWTCQKCGKDLYNDICWEYYYDPIIKKILELIVE